MKSSPTADISVNRPLPWHKIWLITGMFVVGCGILFFTYRNFTPVFRTGSQSRDTDNVVMPDVDLTAWRRLPVQHLGRYKPFETACREVMRQVAGREKLNRRDPVAVVVMWMLETDPNNPKAVSQWDDKPIVLCGHEELRKLIYFLNDNGVVQDRALTEGEDLHGHFMSPKELRQFRDRLARLRKENLEKYKDLTTPVKRQLDEAEERLALYESIRGSERPSENSAGPGMKYAEEKPSDPFAFVALDEIPGSPWFSIADLRLVYRNSSTWHEVYMAERVKKAPQLYISGKHQAALERFQAQLKGGNAEEAFTELKGFLDGERKKTVATFVVLRGEGKRDEADSIIETALWALPSTIVEGKPALSEDLRQAAVPIVRFQEQEKKEDVDNTNKIAGALSQMMSLRDSRILDEMHVQLPTAKQGYDPADPKFRMLHLTYMETRYPEIYKSAVTAQAVPKAKIAKVLEDYASLAAAYRSGDNDRFAAATKKYFETLQNQSTPPYPGSDSVGDRIGAVLTGAPLNPPNQDLLDLEQTFNRVSPFQWAWVLMLLSMLFFCLSLGLDSKPCYLAGWACFLGSLGFQLFGFFVRVTISGRPPVTNMYETVIWVAFMSAIFGAVLEAIYRKKVIAVAAALVATLGLVLADQLPLALDPKINPLVPVLRSNFWLTIHVLVIVSSYAGGTLAWGLGNVALFLILFGKNRGDTIRMLSNFTYRALQIAVLLLAAGTFLGGWWAAYSWGRFWGWDPKETGALIALVCYVIPLHMRYIGWIKDFGLAVAAILCYAAILMSWYGVNFVFPAGLHSYGAGNGSAGWVYWACLINIEWVLAAAWIYRFRLPAQTPALATAGVSVAVSSEAIQTPGAIAPVGSVEKASEHMKA